MSEIINGLSSLDLWSFIPAVGAVTLSVKNWLDLRRGANIEPLPVIDYGLWTISSGNSRNKVMVLPLTFKNQGVSDGVITDLKLAFGSSSQYTAIDIRRRVKLLEVSEQGVKNMDLTQFRNKVLSSVNPMFPIEVPAHGSVTIIVEAFDGKQALPLGSPAKCKIEVTQGNGRINQIEFPFELSQQQFDDSVNNLTWVRSN